MPLTMTFYFRNVTGKFYSHKKNNNNKVLANRTFTVFLVFIVQQRCMLLAIPAEVCLYYIKETAVHNEMLDIFEENKGV